MSQQQPIRVVVEKKGGCFSGCGSTLAILLLVGLAVKYWYLALGLIVLIAAGALVARSRQREQSSCRPGPRDPWLNEVAVALADLELTEQACNTGTQLGGVPLEGDTSSARQPSPGKVRSQWSQTSVQPSTLREPSPARAPKIQHRDRNVAEGIIGCAPSRNAIAIVGRRQRHDPARANEKRGPAAGHGHVQRDVDGAGVGRPDRECSRPPTPRLNALLARKRGSQRGVQNRTNAYANCKAEPPEPA